MALLQPRHRRHVKRVGVHVGHQIVIQVPIAITGTINLQLPSGELGQILTIGVAIIIAVEILRNKIRWLR